MILYRDEIDISEEIDQPHSLLILEVVRDEETGDLSQRVTATNGFYAFTRTPATHWEETREHALIPKRVRDTADLSQEFPVSYLNIIHAGFDTGKHRFLIYDLHENFVQADRAEIVALRFRQAANACRMLEHLVAHELPEWIDLEEWVSPQDQERDEILTLLETVKLARDRGVNYEGPITPKLHTVNDFELAAALAYYGATPKQLSEWTEWSYAKAWQKMSGPQSIAPFRSDAYSKDELIELAKLVGNPIRISLRP